MRYRRAPEHDRRIGRGDDHAGDARLDIQTGQLRMVAVGWNPNKGGDQPVRCPECAGTSVHGETGDQTPHTIGYPGELNYHEFFDWVEFTCRDCGHQWREKED